MTAVDTYMIGKKKQRIERQVIKECRGLVQSSRGRQTLHKDGSNQVKLGTVQRENRAKSSSRKVETTNSRKCPGIRHQSVHFVAALLALRH